MKREKLFSLIIGTVLAFCISFGGVAGIITGFSLGVTDGSVSPNFYKVPADIATVAVFCAVFSVAAAIAFSYRRGGWVLLGAMALSLGYLWRAGILETSVEAVLYRITYVYNLAYRCGYVKWTDSIPAEISPNVGLCVIGALCALSTAWVSCRRKSAILPVFCGCVTLGTCFVVTDTVPAIWCLFLLITGLLLLVLTNTVRRRSAADGNRLTAILLIPAVLYVSLLFGFVPPEEYEAGNDDLQQEIMDWFQGVNTGQWIDTDFSGDSVGAVDLSTVGPKTNFIYAVMDVTSDVGGVVYLRGQSLDIYDGTSWKPSEFSSEKDGGWPTVNCTAAGTVKLVTRSVLPIKYFTYNPGGPHWPEDGKLKDGTISNPNREKEYSFQQMVVVGKSNALLSPELEKQCLQLPRFTKTQAAEYLKKAGYYAGQPQRDIARILGEYVSASAEYNLNTGRMPADESDFAMWFLRDSETGYCVHFATAATVLLRAAGVPARYVSGYVIKTNPGKKATVTENRAHAWVEYFIEGEGWKVLDPTPSNWYEEDPDVVVTEPSAPTAPSTEATEPADTEPTTARPTLPDDQPTGPSQEPTTPEGNTGVGSGQMKIDLSWLWVVLKWLGMLLSVCLVAVGQIALRRRLRSKRLHTGHPNQRALARWRMVLRMSRLIKEQPPEELYELAEKAKFSQHTITVGERLEFDRYLDHAQEQLRKINRWKRLLIRLIWAV